MRQKPDKYYDLAIVDPPYGMRGNTFQLKNKKFTKGHSSAKLDKNNSKIGLSLSAPPGKKYFDELFRISKNQIVFGMQYFTKYLPSRQCVIVWDKMNGANYFSDAEIAWTSFDTAVRLARIHNPPNNRIHPTQKTVKLYRWILQNYAKSGDKIIDTHGGSMTIAIAADIEGFDLDICEINKEYFDAGVKQFNDHKLQLTLF
ncbi:MAG: DNA methyltransferase [bacterium]